MEYCFVNTLQYYILWQAGPLSRKDVDAMNDETFGSLECSNDDRAEEEKKRRGQCLLLLHLVVSAVVTYNV